MGYRFNSSDPKKHNKTFKRTSVSICTWDASPPPSPGIASPRGYCQAPHPPGADSPSWNAHPGPDRSPAEVALGREYHSHPGTEKLGESGSFWPAKHIKTWEFSVPLFQTKPNHTGSLGHTGSSAWYWIESLEEGDACLGLNSDPITRFIQRFFQTQTHKV